MDTIKVLRFFLSLSVLLCLPFVLRWMAGAVGACTVLMKKSPVLQLIKGLVFAVAIATVMSYWAPGMMWADSVYIAYIMILFSIGWSADQVYQLNVPQARGDEQRHRFGSMTRSLMLASSVFVLTLLMLVVQKENVWLASNLLFTCSTMIAISLSTIFGQTIGTYIVRKGKSHSVHSLVNTISFLWGAALFAPSLFPHEWYAEVVRIPQCQLILWGILPPSLILLLLSTLLRKELKSEVN